jgi:type VI secretion system secreted protein Hcp
MPIPAYMTITNRETQKIISTDASSAASIGTLSQANRKDEIIVQQLTTNVTRGTNVQTGAVTNERQHKPVEFTKYMDKSSPLLWEALCEGTQLDIELVFSYTPGKGGPEPYFRMKWEECVLVDGKAHYPLALRPENGSISHLEDWSFVYKTVTWEHTKASTIGTDNSEG